MKHSLISIAVAAFINSAIAFSASGAVCASGTLDDFTYRGAAASACEAQGGNEGETLDAFDESWDLLVKFDGDQDTAIETVFTGSPLTFGAGTITFGLKYLGDPDGDGWYGYELLAADNPDSVLPASMDLVGLVKQSNGYQAYLFEAALVDDSGNLGTFKSLFGPNASGDFSHFTVFGGNYVVDGGGGGGGGGGAPEPATLALVGLGLLATAVSCRRRRA